MELMTFKNKIFTYMADNTIKNYYPHKKTGRYSDNAHSLIDYETNKKGDDEITIKLCIGGRSGGNCWGGTAETFINDITDRSEGVDYFVTRIVELFCMNAPYIIVKKFQNSFLENYTTDSEYYGNCSDFVVYSIKISDIYAILKDYL